MKSQSSKFYLIHSIVAVIGLACLLMNGPMRDGLPLDNTIEERVAFISENEVLWVISWITWMASALGLLVFCSILADEVEKSYLSNIGLTIVAIGIAPDLIAEVIYAFIIPDAIAYGLHLNSIKLLESIAMHLTGFLGNGLYNLGGITLTILAIRQRLFPAWVAVWGIAAWILGLLLSVSVAVNALKAAEIFTATSMILSTSWMLVFAYKVVKK